MAGILLTATDTTNVGGYSSVYDDVVLTIVIINSQPTQDDEPAAKVQFPGKSAQVVLELGQWKGCFADMPKR